MKKLMWAILVIIAVVYCVVVYGWWQEGNRNQNGVQLNHDPRATSNN